MGKEFKKLFDITHKQGFATPEQAERIKELREKIALTGTPPWMALLNQRRAKQ